MSDGEHISPGSVVVIPSNQNLTISARSVKQDLPKYWDREHINATLATIENHQHKMFLRFLWMSGVRITEAVTLRKQDIDCDHDVMRVRWLKSRKYRERNVPLHPRLKDLLQLYTAPMKADARVFPFTRQRGWQICKKYFNGHPHQFRHSFAVNWLRCGGDIVVLHRVLGHAKIQTTMEYLKIVPTDQGRELLRVEFG